MVAGEAEMEEGWEGEGSVQVFGRRDEHSGRVEFPANGEQLKL